MTTKTTRTHVAKGKAPARAAKQAAKVQENADKVSALNEATSAAQKRLDEAKTKPLENRVDRVAAAKAEAEAIKAWEKGGKKGARPSSVNHDAILVQHANGGARTAKTSKAKGPKRERVEIAVLFFTGSTDFEGSRHNRLSAVAARNKMSVDELRKLLDAAGITDPETKRWKLTLPSGVVVGARLPGDPAPQKPAKSAKPAAKASKTSKASKSTTKKTTAAKRDVTPLPKTSTAKKTTKRTTSPKTPTEIGRQAAAQKAASTRRSNARKSA